MNLEGSAIWRLFDFSAVAVPKDRATPPGGAGLGAARPLWKRWIWDLHATLGDKVLGFSDQWQDARSWKLLCIASGLAGLTLAGAWGMAHVGVGMLLVGGVLGALVGLMAPTVVLRAVHMLVVCFGMAVRLAAILAVAGMFGLIAKWLVT